MGIAVPSCFPDPPQHKLNFDPGWLRDVVETLGRSGMAVGALLALILDNTIPGTDEERGLTAWQK